MSPLKSKPSFGRLRTKSLSEADVPSPTTPTSPLSPVSLKSSKSYGKLRKKKIPTEIVPPLPPLPSSPTTPTTPKTPFLKAKSSLGKLRGKAASQEDVPPLPPMPAEFATGMSPTYISQWVSNVNRLSKKERDRAVLTASAVDHNLSAGDNYDLYDTLKAFKEQDSLRSDITEMAATSARAADYYCPVVEDPRVDDTKVEDPRMEEIRARAKKSGEELPKGLNIVPWPAGDSPPNTPGSDTSRIPTAPKSPITPTPASITQAESSAAKNPRKNERRFSAPVRPSSPRSRALYEELLEMVDDLTVEIQKEELVPKLEAAVEAASRVLDMANEEFERFYSLSQPANTHERMEPFRNSGTYPQRESVDLPASGKAIMWATKILEDKQADRKLAASRFNETTISNSPPKQSALAVNLDAATKAAFTLERKATLRRLSTKPVPKPAVESSYTSFGGYPLHSPVEEGSEEKASVESRLATLTPTENPDDVTTRQKRKARVEFRKSSPTLGEDFALRRAREGKAPVEFRESPPILGEDSDLLRARKGKAPVELKEMSPTRMKDLPVTKRRERKARGKLETALSALDKLDLTNPRGEAESTASRESSSTLMENPDVVKLLERRASTESVKSTATMRRVPVVETPRGQIDVEKRRRKGHAPEMTELRNWSDSLREMGLDIEAKDDEKEDEQEEPEEEEGGFF